MSELVCASGVELLMDYLEGELEAPARAAVDSHVAGCPRCIAFIEAYRATPGIFRRATAASLPEELATALVRAMRNHFRANEEPSR